MQDTKDQMNDKGVSAVIAVILMVAITVVLAGVLYVWVMGMADMGEGRTSAALSGQRKYKGDGETYNLTINLVTPSKTFWINNIAIFLEDDDGVNQFRADFSDKDVVVDYHPHIYKVPGTEDNQNVTIVDNDGNGNLGPSDKIWIEGGLAQPGYKLLVKHQGTTIGIWSAP